MEIMSDPELVKAIEEGKADMEAGRVISLEDLEKEYAKEGRKKKLKNKR